MTNENGTTKARPTHRLYQVTDTRTGAYWKPIGSAWPNADGLGFSIACDAVPLQGRIVLRVIKPRQDDRQGRLV